MERAVLDLWVGIFVAAGLGGPAGSGAAGEQRQHLQHRRQLHVTAAFDNIGGLKVRAPVKSAGVLVGRVDGIEFDNAKFVARVTMRLDRRYQFPDRHHRLDPHLRAARRAVHRARGGRRRADGEGRADA